MRAVQAGAAPAVLVAAADVRVAAPESELEGVLGDGAAALTVADDDVIAELVDAASVAEEFTYVWRTDVQRTRAGRRRPLLQHLRLRARPRRRDHARCSSASSLEPKAIDALALYSPDARAAADLAKSLGFDPQDAARSNRCSRRSAAPAPPSRCCCWRARSTSAKPGRAASSSAATARAPTSLLLPRHRRDRRRAAPRRRSARWLAAKTPLASYEKYLKFRRLIEVEEVTDVVTNVLEFKELKQDVRLYGSRCRECGQVQYPMARVCIRCRAQERIEDARIARRGTVFTFTVDHLIANLEHPLPMAVIDADGGGRLYLQVADADDIADRRAGRAHLPPPARGRRQPQLLLEGAADPRRM